MKTFKDLDFKAHAKLGVEGRACLLFDNGYGVSVVHGDESVCKTNKAHPFEMAVIKHKGVDDGSIVLLKEFGYLTEECVTKHMVKIQKLK